MRRLCCETGFLGNPIDPVFEDRRLFADFLTGYYTDWEPESAFVIEVDGEVKGTCSGPASRSASNSTASTRTPCSSCGCSGITGAIIEASRRFVHWILLHGWREVPAAPRRTAHFHINLLAEARNVPTTRALMDAYLAYLAGTAKSGCTGRW